MKLYKARIRPIAAAVVERLTHEGDIELAVEIDDDEERQKRLHKTKRVPREEAMNDLVAIMEMYLRRDNELREAVRDEMERKSIPYDEYGKVKGEISEQWGHPTGDDVDRFLARQFIENFMNSPFVGEVFTDDRELYKKILDILKDFDVDERALRAEAEERIKNVREGSVERQDALNRALKEVKKRHGLLNERS
jgi:proline dehydrogenase